MIHILTMGHLDPAAVGRRQAIVLRPLEMGILNRLLQELGLAAWHGDGRTITFREIRAIFRKLSL